MQELIIVQKNCLLTVVQEFLAGSGDLPYIRNGYLNRRISEDFVYNGFCGAN